MLAIDRKKMEGQKWTINLVFLNNTLIIIEVIILGLFYKYKKYILSNKKSDNNLLCGRYEHNKYY